MQAAPITSTCVKEPKTIAQENEPYTKEEQTH